MKRVQRFIELLVDRQIRNDWDAIIPIVGNEGVGKSTFTLEFMGRYQRYRDADASPDAILNKIVFDDSETFRQRLKSADRGDPIAAMDAAHILHKKETMRPDQIKTEKSLLDIRIENYVILLGYQDWDDIPTVLQKRRAEYCFRITSRGVVSGYNRRSMDEKFEEGEWPTADLRDRFPNLEGTDIWERFQQLDAEHKRQRLSDEDETEGDEGPTPQNVLSEILERDPGEYVEQNEFNEQRYISKPLIKLDYPELSDQQAEQVKHGIRRETTLLESEDEEESAAEA